ncbi:ADP-forming succinate--CoA ligase subunit beta [Lentisphaera araneosa]|uniref:ADP-forming succinate--CoA ligase subunit beta n=1 Tax=Lentisphaera araneosa TaxID=256847 RepID=UPI0009FDE2B3|nr:ADP-forming succinate--CoA ligase subunit beta [Lentisphaera araneosa]
MLHLRLYKHKAIRRKTVLIHEYQARDLFREYGIPVTEGKVFESLEGVEEYATELGQCVVKAQVHAGGRGKGGGVKFAPTVEKAIEHATNILGMQLITHQTTAEGCKVNKILLCPGLDIAKEYYLALTIDRATQCPFIIASTEGGMDIEEVAESTPEKITKIKVDPSAGCWAYHGRKVADALGFEGKQARIVAAVAQNLYKMFMEKDCSIVEINPLVVTEDNEIYAIDGKVNFDSNALYRQKDIVELRDPLEEEPLEVEASEHDLAYIKLDGNVACMVNGAGLAMATMDMIQISGGSPANFLDVGGTATPARVEQAFRILLKDPNVEGILINVFGGIVRCDLVAEGVIEAVKNIGNIEQPIVIRLSGTNSTEGKKLLAESDLTFETADSLNEAAAKIVAAVKK